MGQDILRVTDALRSEMDDLSVKLGDWAQWDDTYQYAADHNEEYVISNLQNETFEMLGLDVVLIADGSGATVFKKNIENGEEKPFQDTLEQYFSNKVPQVFSEGRNRYEDIINTPEGTLIYAARPITSSDGKSPAGGFMVFGYFFDQNDADSLGRVTRLNVRYAGIGDGRFLDGNFAEANKYLSREHPIYMSNTQPEDVISGYVLVDSGHGKPAMLLGVNASRDIYQKGKESIVLFVRFMLAVSLVFMAIIFLIFDRLVLRKIARLADQVKDVRESGDLNANILLPGKDEFSKLAKEVNGMLESMRENEARRQQQVDEMERLNKLMINRELRMIELKQKIRGLEQKDESGT
jgi:sensor domain CHASE-containing protein